MIIYLTKNNNKETYEWSDGLNDKRIKWFIHHKYRIRRTYKMIINKLLIIYFLPSSIKICAKSLQLSSNRLAKYIKCIFPWFLRTEKQNID